MLKFRINSLFFVLFLFVVPVFSTEKKIVLVGPGYVQGQNLPADKRLDVLLKKNFKKFRPQHKFEFINEGDTYGIPSFYADKMDQILLHHKPTHVLFFVGMGSMYVGEYISASGISEACPFYSWLFRREKFSEEILSVTVDLLKSYSSKIKASGAKPIFILATSKIDPVEFRKAHPVCMVLGSLFPFKAMSGDEIHRQFASSLDTPVIFPQRAVQKAYQLSAQDYVKRRFSLEGTESYATDILPWIIPEVMDE